MSGRIKNLVAWAAGSFAAGANPWSGTVKRVANVSRALTPGLAAAAQEVNDAFGEIVDAINGVLGQTGSLAALNWHTVKATKPFTAGHVTISRVAWDGFAKTPRLCCLNAGSGVAGELVPISYDGGRTFVAHTVDLHAGCDTYAAAWNPSTGTHVFCTSDSTPAAGAAPTGVDTGDWTVANAVWFAAGSVLVTAGRNGSTQKLQSVSGTTLTDRSAQLPANMIGGASSAQDVFFAQSATTLLVFADVVGSGGGANYTSTTDGATYTTRTSPISGSFKVVSCVYDGASFVVVATDGTDTKIYASAAGISSWSLVATLTGIVCNGAASSGACIAATMFVGGRQRLYVSTDAGATWAVKGNWATNATTDKVASVADGEGFMTWSTAAGEYAASNVTG